MAASARALRTAALVLLLGAVSAFAHKPVAIGGMHSTPDEAVWMDEIDVSQVVYAELDDTHRALWLTFAVDAPTRLDLSLGIPVLERLVDYRPSLAVIGPGLAPVDLPFETPLDSGVVFETSSDGGASFFHEPFTGTDSWILLEASVDLLEPGVYYIVTWAPDERADKLWVAVGVREQFGLTDLLSLGSIIREVRAFHEVPPPAESSRVVSKLLFLGLAGALIALLVSGVGAKQT